MSAFGTKGHCATEFQCPLLGVKRTSILFSLCRGRESKKWVPPFVRSVAGPVLRGSALGHSARWTAQGLLRNAIDAMIERALRPN